MIASQHLQDRRTTDKELFELGSISPLTGADATEGHVQRENVCQRRPQTVAERAQRQRRAGLDPPVQPVKLVEQIHERQVFGLRQMGEQ